MKITAKYHLYANQDLHWLLLLTVGVPLFFPLVWMGLMPSPLHPGLGDTYVFFEPMTLATIKAIQAGNNPFWMHEAGIGAPVLLSLGAGILHPLHLLHFVLPDAAAFVLAWWLRLALMGAFAYLYLRKIKTEAWIAGIATLGLIFGSVNLNYSHEIIGFGLCFFPAILYFAEINQESLKLYALTLLAFCIFFMLIGGFLSVTLYLIILFGIYTLCRFQFYKFMWLQLFVIAGLVIGGSAIYEVFTFYPTSGFDENKRNALFMYTPELKNILSWWYPSIWGNITEFRQSGERDFYGRLLNSGILAPLILIIGTIITLWTRPKIRGITVFWLSCLFSCFAIYFNLFNIKLFLQYIPLLGQHPTTRLQVVIALATTFSFATLIQDLALENTWQKYKSNYKIVATLLIFILLVGLLNQSMINWRVIFYSMMMVMIVLMWPSAIKGKLSARAIVLGLVIASSVATTHIYTVYSPYSSYYPNNELKKQIISRLKPGGRVLDLGDQVFNQTAIAYGVSSITQLWFAPKAFKQSFNKITTQPLNALTYESVNNLDWDKGEILWQTLAMLHVQLVLMPNHEFEDLQSKLEHSNFWRFIARDHENAVIEVKSLIGENDKIQGKGYKDYSENGGYINLTAHGANLDFIEIPIRFHKDWHVEIAQQNRIELKESEHGLIQIIGVKNGESIKLKYWPQHLYPALTLSVVFWMFLLFTFFIRNKLINWFYQSKHEY